MALAPGCLFPVTHAPQDLIRHAMETFARVLGLSRGAGR